MARPQNVAGPFAGSNLDEAGHRAVEAIVAEQRERGSVVLATNDPAELALADDRVTL